MKKHTKLEIGSADAVIILRPDGTYDTSLPTIAGDNVPDHLVTAASVIYALQDPDMMDFLLENFNKQCQSLKEPRTLALFPGLKS